MIFSNMFAHWQLANPMHVVEYDLYCPKGNKYNEFVFHAGTCLVRLEKSSIEEHGNDRNDFQTNEIQDDGFHDYTLV